MILTERNIRWFLCFFEISIGIKQRFIDTDIFSKKFNNASLRRVTEILLEKIYLATKKELKLISKSLILVLKKFTNKVA
jgi:hypothetical protein